MDGAWRRARRGIQRARCAVALQLDCGIPARTGAGLPPQADVALTLCGRIERRRYPVDCRRTHTGDSSLAFLGRHEWPRGLRNLRAADFFGNRGCADSRAELECTALWDR